MHNTASVQYRTILHPCISIVPFQRKHFARNWSFVWWIPRSPVNSPHRRQWRGALVFSLIFARTNSWANNGDAGDLLKTPWASWQIRKITGCACAGNAGNVFLRHRLQRKPLVSDPDMHHGTCVTHVPWCMSGSLTRGVRENVLGIPGVCPTRNFTYLVRGPSCPLWRQCNENFALDTGLVPIPQLLPIPSRFGRLFIPSLEPCILLSSSWAFGGYFASCKTYCVGVPGGRWTRCNHERSILILILLLYSPYFVFALRSSLLIVFGKWMFFDLLSSLLWQALIRPLNRFVIFQS